MKEEEENKKIREADAKTLGRRKGFAQLASDNSAFARMNSLRDYMAHADWTRDPF
jgi:hypothetical protein